ncbi:MAG: oligosaccharide repeat unit polymerase [Bryobacterales bacterium]|nr:oligosaccharide repeat unit polymerase [Bryobacterales bacterium]
MTTRVHIPWWSRPELALALVSVPVLLAAYFIPASTYLEEWRTPKYFSERYLLFALAAVATFCVSSAGAAYVVRESGFKGVENEFGDGLPWDKLLAVFYGMAALTIVGYVAWAGAAIVRGADLKLVFDILGGSRGAASRMKEVYLVTIPGVTTLTQFGIPSVILGALLLTRYAGKRIVPVIACLFVFTFARAFFNSERLAVIEMALPAIIVGAPLAAGRKDRKWWMSPGAIAVAPVVGFIFVFGLFAASEYFRSWLNFYAAGHRSFPEFIAARFTGYYATALNNGAFLSERLLPLDYPFFSIRFLYRFPLLNTLIRSVFESPFEREEAMLDILSRGANPEFNNGGGLLLPFIDWGFPGGLFFWMVAGLAAGASYASFRRMKLAGILTYPILFTAVIEAPRVLYAAEGRVFPAWCAVVVALAACRTPSAPRAAAGVAR